MLAAMFDSICAAKAEKDGKRDVLREQINNVKMQIALVDDLFNLTDDEDLIEACIYQSKAFWCYYRYLLKLAKEQPGTSLAGMELQAEGQVV